MGSVLDSPIASALRAPAFLIKAFGKLCVDLGCPDTPFLFLFFCFTVPLAAREGSGESIPRLPRMVMPLAGCSLLWAHLKALLAAVKASPTCRESCLWIPDPSFIPFPTVPLPLELRNRRQFLCSFGGIASKAFGLFQVMCARPQSDLS